MEDLFLSGLIWWYELHKKEVYNLNSQKTPPNNKLLDPFEADLFKLIKKIRFRRDYNSFQMKLNKDIKEF